MQALHTLTVLANPSPLTISEMSGIVRYRLVSFISNSRSRLLFNPNNKKLITTTSSASPGTAQHHPKSPAPPPLSTGSWKDKLRSRSLKYLVLGYAAGVASTAIFTYYSFAEVRNKFQNNVGGTLLVIRKMNFDFDEHDLVWDEDIRKLYDRWMKHYGVSRRRKDKGVHYQAFKESAYHVYFYNRTHENCKFELNKFADYTKEEWKQMNSGLKLDDDEVNG